MGAVGYVSLCYAIRSCLMSGLSCPTPRGLVGGIESFEFRVRLFCGSAALLGVVGLQDEPESLILAQSERWRHA